MSNQMLAKTAFVLDPLQREIVGKTIESLGNTDTWCKGHLAMYKHGFMGGHRATLFDDPRATSFCALGWMMKHAVAAGVSRSNARIIADSIDKVFTNHSGTFIAFVNNDEGREAVIAKLTELHDLAK